MVLYDKQQQKLNNEAATLRLSQCMIVKNEERNIKKALLWGRKHAFEQIVVDTGSTDRTKEIAERLGAKVLEYEWVDDFSAAKNFAIDQATGDWIAFLDADEYFTAEDAANAAFFLEAVSNGAAGENPCLAVFCPWVHLNDDGSVKSVDTQIRLFRNQPDIRYKGRVHEWLTVDWKYALTTSDFRIMHTGYSDSSYRLTGKAKRNIELLRAAMQERPDNLSYKAYLADSLLADAEKGTGGDAERIEAKKLYREVAVSEGFILPDLKKNAYVRVLEEYALAPGTDEICEGIAEKAIAEFPNDNNIICLYAAARGKKGDYRTAFEALKKCEANVDEAMAKGKEITADVMTRLSAQMIMAAQALGDLDTVIKYAAVQLMMNKTNNDVLRPFIGALMKRYASMDEATEMLAQVYNMSDPNDILLVARAAKDCGAIDLARRIIGMAT